MILHIRPNCPAPGCVIVHPGAAVTFTLPGTLEDVRVIVRNELGAFMRASGTDILPDAWLEATPAEWATLRAMSCVDGDAWLANGLTMGQTHEDVPVRMTNELTGGDAID